MRSLKQSSHKQISRRFTLLNGWIVSALALSGCASAFAAKAEITAVSKKNFDNSPDLR